MCAPDQPRDALGRWVARPGIDWSAIEAKRNREALLNEVWAFICGFLLAGLFGVAAWIGKP
jgi:hypothetical protein